MIFLVISDIIIIELLLSCYYLNLKNRWKIYANFHVFRSNPIVSLAAATTWLHLNNGNFRKAFHMRSIPHQLPAGPTNVTTGP